MTEEVAKNATCPGRSMGSENGRPQTDSTVLQDHDEKNTAASSTQDEDRNRDREEERARVKKRRIETNT